MLTINEIPSLFPECLYKKQFLGGPLSAIRWLEVAVFKDTTLSGPSKEHPNHLCNPLVNVGFGSDLYESLGLVDTDAIAVVGSS